MQVYIQEIEEADLPNYIETTFSKVGAISHEAPLAAKYRVDLIIDDTKLELFFEIREQPHGALVDEYYEDQVYDALMSVLSTEFDENTRVRVYNTLSRQIEVEVFGRYKRIEKSFPIPLSTEHQ